MGANESNRRADLDAYRDDGRAEGRTRGRREWGAWGGARAKLNGRGHADATQNEDAPNREQGGREDMTGEKTTEDKGILRGGARARRNDGEHTKVRKKEDGPNRKH